MSAFAHANPAKHSALNKVSQIAQSSFAGHTRKSLIVGIGNTSLSFYEDDGLFLAFVEAHPGKRGVRQPITPHGLHEHSPVLPKIRFGQTGLLKERDHVKCARTSFLNVAGEKQRVGHQLASATAL